MESLVTLFRRATGELDVVDEAAVERDSCGALRVAAPSVNLAIDTAIDAGIVRLAPASTTDAERQKA